MQSKQVQILQSLFDGRWSNVHDRHDGLEDLQAFLNRAVDWIGAPVTASEVMAKEAEYDAAQLAKVVPAIKAEAQRRILILAPEWRQRNMLARAAELLEIVTFGGALTPEQETERQALIAGRAAIQAIRDKSNALESSLSTMTPAEFAAFNPGDDVNWV